MAYLELFDFGEAGRSIYLDLSVLELFATSLVGCRGWYRGYLVWRGGGRVKAAWEGEDPQCRLYETANVVAYARHRHGSQLSQGTAAVWLDGRRVEGRHERWVMGLGEPYYFEQLQRLIYELMRRYGPPPPTGRAGGP